MKINIKNETLPLCSGICRTKNNFVTECDVIVPDSKPDILRVLQMSARPRITACETRAGHVIVSGTIGYDILYLADDEEKCVKSITSSCEFSTLIRDSNISEAMLTFSDIDVRELNCTVANCRKLSLRISLCVNLQIYSCCNLDVITDIEGACTQKYRISSGVICAHAQDNTVITDSFKLAAGKAPIIEILTSDAQITDTELKVIDDKAIFKGTMRVTVLYKSESGIEYAQTETSFAHVLEASGIHDDMDFEHLVKPIEISVSFSSGDENAPCMIDYSVQMFLRVIARCTQQLDCVTDAFLPHGLLECSFSPISADCIETVINKDVDFREKIILPDNLPSIDTIYQVVARPFTESCIIEDGKLRISGYTEVYLLYLSNDEEAPACSYKANVDFSVTCDSPGCTITPVSSARLRNISYTISNESSIDIRGCVDVTVQCIKTVETDIIYDAQCGNYIPVERPSIIVSCICDDRSLWDISKEYCVNPCDILMANGFENETEIKPGMALIIPK